MEDIASRIVDKAVSLGCQDAVADVIENRSYQIRFARNEAVISNQWRESSASVFLVHDRRVVATDIKDLTKADEAVERLVKTAKASQPNPEYAGIAKGPSGMPAPGRTPRSCPSTRAGSTSRPRLAGPSTRGR